MANRESVVLSLFFDVFPWSVSDALQQGRRSCWSIMLVMYMVLGILTFGWAIAALHPSHDLGSLG